MLSWERDDPHQQSVSPCPYLLWKALWWPVSRALFLFIFLSCSEFSVPRWKQWHESTNFHHWAELPSWSLCWWFGLQAPWGPLSHYGSCHPSSTMCVWSVQEADRQHLSQTPPSSPSWKEKHRRLPSSLKLQIRYRCWKWDALKEGRGLELILMGREAMRRCRESGPCPVGDWLPCHWLVAKVGWS